MAVLVDVGVDVLVAVTVCVKVGVSVKVGVAVADGGLTLPGSGRLWVDQSVAWSVSR